MYPQRKPSPLSKTNRIRRIRGIEFGELVLEFCKDNVIILARGKNEHFTLESGENSGILDFHYTWRDPNGIEHHEPLFAMKTVDIPALLAELTPETMNIFQIVRRLRIGWLYRNCIDIVTGVDPITDEDVLGISTRRHRRKRIVIDEEAVRQRACLLEDPDDIWNLPDATFSLVAAGRKIGVGMKLTDRARFTRLYWFRLRDLSRVSRAFQDHCICIQVLNTKERNAGPTGTLRSCH
jgi:hypothetical protein